MGCRLSCRVLPYLVHENAFESECTRATMHAALETCVCPRDVIAPFRRRWRDIDSSLFLSLSLARLFAFREWKARPEINWTWNGRIERVGEKFEYLFFFFFFFFSLWFWKKYRKNREKDGQARKVSKFDWLANNLIQQQARRCTRSRFCTRLIAKISFHIWCSPINAFPRISISHNLLPEILQPAVAPGPCLF